MAPSDHPRDPTPGPPKVPALINDYRAQRDAWRAQARDLARLREQVLAAADREARDIAAAVRSDIRQILLKARRELLVLAAQVEAATNAPQDAEPAQQGDANDLVRLHADDLHPAQEAYAWARRDMHRILDEARPDLEALAGEAGALRSSLIQSHAPVRTAPLSRPPAPSPFQPPRAAESPRISYSDSHRVRRSLTGFVIVFITLGLAIVIATGWWLRRSTAPRGPSPQQTIEPVTEAVVPQPEETPLPAPAPAEPAEIPAGLSVNIEARRLAWMRVTVDGRVAAARLFEAGETQQIDGAQQVSIRAGDAGAVFVSVDGGEASALGRDGQVVTRRFALEPPASPAGSLPPPSIGDLSVVPNRDLTETALPEPLLPTNADQDARPQAGASELPALEAPAVVDTGAPAVAPQSAAKPAAAGTSSLPRDTASAASASETLVGAAERWLDAYYRQDRTAMAAVATADMSISDERTDNERLPRGLAGVRRTLDDVNIQVFGDNALVTARMTERFEDVLAARMLMASSFVSQMWARRADRWQLDNVRIVGAATLNRTIR